MLTQIHNEIKKEKKEKILKTIDDLIVEPNDSRKMFSVVKNLKRMKPQKPLLIKTKGGLSTSDEKEQANIIAEHFKKIFFKNAETYPNITPVPMSQPFTKEEVKEAVKGMKNGKSPGIDEVNVELIKYATQEIYSKIADIYNSIASTGLYPKELTSGIITPLQKPGKKRGPAENLRPIILLSILRKILSIIMMKRMKTRIQNVIPKCQAAYQSGRSTTEQTFAMKVAAERTITSPK